MDLPIDAADIERAEMYLAAGDLATAVPLIQRLTELFEDYASTAFADTEHTQWFSFADTFERLAYRRVENDPRELVQLGAPVDRLYAAQAFGFIRQQDWISARNALMQAVRWNPMNCNYRLDLAEIFRALEDPQEWAQLSFSVIERASDGLSAARAYANLGQFFLDQEAGAAAAACAQLAVRLAPSDPRVMKLMNRISSECPQILDDTEENLRAALMNEGIPTAPSTDIAVCLLMCATDAARDGDTAAATGYTVRANNLIGEEACKLLVRAIRESDDELAQQSGAGE